MMGVAPNLVRLNQSRQFISWEERRQLAIKAREMALVREIKMGNGRQDWLFARTIVPNNTLRGVARRIAFLNDTPIGNILFGRNGAIRKSMNIRLITELPSTVIDLGILPNHPLWQRISIFEFQSGPLMVTELFLPGCPIYTI